jgi:hypothetical protein
MESKNVASFKTWNGNIYAKPLIIIIFIIIIIIII